MLETKETPEYKMKWLWPFRPWNQKMAFHSLHKSKAIENSWPCGEGHTGRKCPGGIRSTGAPPVSLLLTQHLFVPPRHYLLLPAGCYVAPGVFSASVTHHCCWPDAFCSVLSGRDLNINFCLHVYRGKMQQKFKRRSFKVRTMYKLLVCSMSVS